MSSESINLSPRRLYLDNAATSFPKPREVVAAMTHYAAEIGASAGRGAYREALDSAAILTTCRQRLCRLFNGERPEHFIFTLNCTDALNLALKGLIDPCGTASRQHVIVSHIDHNSILRPVQALVDAGVVEQTRLPIDPQTGLIDPAELRRAIRPTTRYIALTHASNVTGAVQPIRALGQIAREHEAPLIVDAAQSAGHVPIDVQEDCIDILAAPGHKALLGPLGTGFLYVRPGVERFLRPLREGGTGSASDEPRQPTLMPDKYEPGSHNAIGIAGLSAGVDWVLQRGIDDIFAHDRDLCATFIETVGDIAGLTYFGPRGVRDRIGVFSVRIDGVEPQELSSVLEANYGILSRSGIHCAPLIHAALGTLPLGGTTRLSFGPFLSPQDVNFAADALADIALQSVAIK